MTQNRLRQLSEMLAEEPNDPFLIYALGIEYLNTDKSQAKLYFEKLLMHHPDYVGTYYHAAQLYADLGENEKCINTYERGLTVLTNQKNIKLYNELQRAYRNFLDELED